jgi:hypothetical protein
MKYRKAEAKAALGCKSCTGVPLPMQEQGGGGGGGP